MRKSSSHAIIKETERKEKKTLHYILFIKTLLFCGCIL